MSLERAQAAAEFGATAAVAWEGDADATAAAVREASGGGVDHAFEATGRPEAMRAAFLSVRPRGQAVLIGIPRADAELRVPARLIPRGERRVIGALYGSARPERDFPLILDAYRRGRLPLDRLISHRLPLERIEDAFALLREGGARRTVLDARPGGGGVRIAAIETRRYRFPLEPPLRAAWDPQPRTHQDATLVCVVADDGARGYASGDALPDAAAARAAAGRRRPVPHRGRARGVRDGRLPRRPAVDARGGGVGSGRSRAGAAAVADPGRPQRGTRRVRVERRAGAGRRARAPRASRCATPASAR